MVINVVIIARLPESFFVSFLSWFVNGATISLAFLTIISSGMVSNSISLLQTPKSTALALSFDAMQNKNL